MAYSQTKNVVKIQNLKTVYPIAGLQQVLKFTFHRAMNKQPYQSHFVNRIVKNPEQYKMACLPLLITWNI